MNGVPFLLSIYWTVSYRVIRARLSCNQSIAALPHFRGKTRRADQGDAVLSLSRLSVFCAVHTVCTVQCPPSRRRGHLPPPPPLCRGRRRSVRRSQCRGGARKTRREKTSPVPPALSWRQHQGPGAGPLHQQRPAAAQQHTKNGHGQWGTRARRRPRGAAAAAAAAATATGRRRRACALSCFPSRRRAGRPRAPPAAADPLQHTRPRR